MNTKKIGELTEAYVLAALVRTYPSVLLPFGDNQRYDMVFENVDGSFNRVQCKTGRYRNGTIIFNAYSSNYTNPEMKAYTDEIDYFAVKCPEFSEVYLIPVNDCGTTKVTLRVEPSNGRGGPTIRWAADYLIQ